MAEKEINELYIHLTFQYESAIDILLTEQLIDTEFAIATKEKFYNTLDEEKLLASKKIRDYCSIRPGIKVYTSGKVC